MMYLGRSSEVVVTLFESNYEFGYEGNDLIPAAGVLFSDLTMKFWRPGMVAYQTHVLTNADWIELGNGNYVLKIPAALLTAVGFFFVQLTGPHLRSFQQQYSVEPTPINFLQSPNVCIVHGNISDITGSPINPDDEIVFGLGIFPKSIQGSILNSKRIVSRPDAYGNFSIQLLCGIEARVEIKLSGINFKITVPNQPSAALLDLMPPLE